MNDSTRTVDLEELEKLWREAPNSFWRDMYQKQIYKIVNEARDPIICKYRDELVRAVRNNDRRHVLYIQNEINHHMQNRTGGRDIS